MKKKPNIVLITIDSLRADFLGYQNPKEKNTPFLDSFASKSYAFVNGISPANPTFFTFSSIMTGTLPLALGNYLGIPDNNKIKTIAEVLRDYGYGTYAFLADNPALYSIYGYDRGFDYYDDGYEDASKIYLSLSEFLWKLRQTIPEFLLKSLELIKTIFFPPRQSISGEKLNKKIKKYISEDKAKPFFLWVHYMDTHLPYSSGLNKYFYQNKGLFQKLARKIIFYKELTTSIRRMKIRNNEIGEIFKEAYRSCVKFTDENIGELVNFLQKEYPNTVFIIVSDHGEAFMEHGMFGHEAFSLYNEFIHVPILIHVPFAKPRRVTETVSLVSLAKTIAELVGIKVTQFQGNNLITDTVFSSVNNISRILYKCRSPHVRLGILDNKTEIFGYTRLWSFTTPEDKYIKEENGRREEYYLLSKDPGETNNLIKDKAINNSKTVTQLKKIIRNDVGF